MLHENGIPLDTAAIVSTVLEGILYGISIMMFICMIWALTYRRTPSCVNRAMIVVACSMLLLSTAHMVIDIIRTYQGLVEYRNTFQPHGSHHGPIGFFSDVSQWSFVYKNVLYTLQTLVGDGVVIYRCYVLWQSWLIIVFPIILWASVAVTGIGCVYFDSQATITKENVFAPMTGKWITAFLADALFTNVLITSLLAFRIWKLGRRVTGESRSTVPILRIILDAGVLYSVSLLALLVCFVAKNRGHYVMLDLSIPIISITFYMVIIRITLPKSTSEDIARPSSSGSYRLTLSRMSRLSREREYRMKRMEVHITQSTETNEHDEHESGRREPKKDGEAEGGMDPVANPLGAFAL